MQLNGIEVIDRHNRPTVSQKVGLRVFFINDGVYEDPNDISGVTIFAKDRNISPSTVLNNDQLLDSPNVSADVLMHFGASADDGNGGVLDASAYTGGAHASGIYRVKRGEYVVVLDGTVNLSGFYDFDGVNQEVGNQASTVRTYIDVWTVRQVGASTYKTLINEFELFDDTFFSLTEPLLLKATNKLADKHIVLGSKRDLKVPTEVSIENSKVSDADKAIFNDSVITSASLEIVKLNEEPGLPPRVTVSAFSDTSALVDITSDNTIIHTWDTNSLLTHADTVLGNMGSLRGMYTVQVEYNMLNEKIRSPLMHLRVE